MPEQSDSLEVRTAPANSLSPEAARLFELGAASVRAERFEEAHSHLAKAARLAPDNAQIRSLHGVTLAFVERDFERARAQCESATKQEFFNPEVYLNLARVYLAFGRRSEALRYLRRGQMIDPGDTHIEREISRLGRRVRPVVPFLPRRHPLNRVLGEARSRIRTSFFSA